MINDEFQYFYKYAEELSDNFMATRMCNSILRASWSVQYTFEDILKLNAEDVLQFRNIGKKAAELFVKTKELYLERRYWAYTEWVNQEEKTFNACYEALEDDSVRIRDAVLRYKNGDIEKHELYRIGKDVSEDLIHQGRKFGLIMDVLYELKSLG